MPAYERFTVDELDAIRKLSYRDANRQFRVGYRVWARIRRDPTFLPTRYLDPRASTQLAEVVLGKVKEAPHLSAGRLAAALGLRTEGVQGVLRAAGLNKLNARLQFAGYQVEAVRPLQVARLRRILAASPGSLTHQDYKTFGYLRGKHGAAQKRVGGYVVVDSLTGFAALYLSNRPCAAEAVAALRKYCKTSPFRLHGLVLTDNGADFCGHEYSTAVAEEFGCYHRTTQVNHPWSNGKVEALNKTLKYTCFPALGFAAEKDWSTIAAAVDAWMLWYNTRRAHTGWVNQGLPPVAFYELWKKTPGDEAEKLLNLGLLKLDSEWRIRMMGSDSGNAGERPEGSRARGQDTQQGGLPFAFVLERRELAKYTEATGTIEAAKARAREQQTHSLALCK